MHISKSFYILFLGLSSLAITGLPGCSSGRGGSSSPNTVSNVHPVGAWLGETESGDAARFVVLPASSASAAKRAYFGSVVDAQTHATQSLFSGTLTTGLQISGPGASGDAALSSADGSAVSLQSLSSGQRVEAFSLKGQFAPNAQPPSLSLTVTPQAGDFLSRVMNFSALSGRAPDLDAATGTYVGTVTAEKVAAWGQLVVKANGSFTLAYPFHSNGSPDCSVTGTLTRAEGVANTYIASITSAGSACPAPSVREQGIAIFNPNGTAQDPEPLFVLYGQNAGSLHGLAFSTRDISQRPATPPNQNPATSGAAGFWRGRGASSGDRLNLTILDSGEDWGVFYTPQAGTATYWFNGQGGLLSNVVATAMNIRALFHGTLTATDGMLNGPNNTGLLTTGDFNFLARFAVTGSYVNQSSLAASMTGTSAHNPPDVRQMFSGALNAVYDPAFTQAANNAALGGRIFAGRLSLDGVRNEWQFEFAADGTFAAQHVNVPASRNAQTELDGCVATGTYQASTQANVYTMTFTEHAGDAGVPSNGTCGAVGVEMKGIATFDFNAKRVVMTATSAGNSRGAVYAGVQEN